MQRRKRTISLRESLGQHGTVSPPMPLEEHRALILSRPVVIERQVSLLDFEDMLFEERSIKDIMEYQGWVSHLRRSGTVYTDMVRDFYAAILTIADIDAEVWDLTVRGVAIQFSADELAAFMGIERPVGAYPAVETEKRPVEELFKTFQGQDLVVAGSFIRQNDMLPFWRIMHLIFAYCIDPRQHTAECPIARGELMLIVARQVPVDLPLYIFLTIRAEVVTPSTSGLPYGLLLTNFLHAMMVPEGIDEAKRTPLSAINRVTLSRSVAQSRRLHGQSTTSTRRGPDASEAGTSQGPPSLPTVGESSTQAAQTKRPAWADSWMAELKDILMAQLTTMEANSSIMGTTMREELTTMRKDLTSVEGHMSGLSQTLGVALTQLRTLIRRLDDLEEQFGHMRDALGVPDRPDPVA